ncbi:MAG: 3-deoxy-7-phosphoheptulonate synthase [Planctomycetota bacterium]
MILFLEPGIPPGKVERLKELAGSEGLGFRVLDEALAGRRLVLLAAEPSRPNPDLIARVRSWHGVERSISFADPHPMVSSAPETLVIVPRWAGLSAEKAAPPESREIRVGPGHFLWIAGPCSVENPEYLGETATRVARAGATMLRGGAYKPRTSPYSFQGLGREGLLLLAAVARDVGLALVSEVLDPRDVDFVSQHTDLLQIGARNMQNFALLKEAGASGHPVLLKRGPAASIEELLLAAEYLLDAGCPGLMLCERGVKSLDPLRPTLLDLGVIPALREHCPFPLIVDPSHGTGQRSRVIPMAKAAVAAGADGVMVEVHVRPEEARSDGSQALLPEDLERLAADLSVLAELEGRTLSPLVRDCPAEGEEALTLLPRSSARSSDGSRADRGTVRGDPSFRRSKST